MDNYYQLLGVTRNATAIEVKAAFQKQMKALETSPIQGEHRHSHEKMLQQAFLTLLDPKRRAKYDQQVDAGARRVVVLQEPEQKGISLATMAIVAVLLVAVIAGGWYLAHPSAQKREEARKHDEEIARAARAKVEAEGSRNRNPNPLRGGPPTATKDQIMTNAVERAAKESQAPAKPGGALK